MDVRSRNRIEAVGKRMIEITVWGTVCVFTDNSGRWWPGGWHFMPFPGCPLQSLVFFGEL
jgi:hypothetical protein